MIYEIADVGFYPTIRFAMKGIWIHKEGRRGGEGNGGDRLLSERGVMIGFSIKSGMNGCVSSVGFGVDDGCLLARGKVKNPSVVGSAVHGRKPTFLINGS
jgi:hypothetical protein